jgi:hypothetical protein
MAVLFLYTGYPKWVEGTCIMLLRVLCCDLYCLATSRHFHPQTDDTLWHGNRGPISYGDRRQ